MSLELTASTWAVNPTGFLGAFVICLIFLFFLRGVILHYHWKFEMGLDQGLDEQFLLGSVKTSNDFVIKSCDRNVCYSKEAINVFDPEVVKQILVKQSYLFPIISHSSSCTSCNVHTKRFRQSTIKAFGATRIKRFIVVVDRKCIAWASSLKTLEQKGVFYDFGDELESFTQDALLAVVLGVHTLHLQPKLIKLKESWRNLSRLEKNHHCMNLSKRQDIDVTFTVQLSNIVSEVALGSPGGGFLHSIMTSCDSLQPTDCQRHTCQQPNGIVEFLSQFLLCGQQSLCQALKFAFLCLENNFDVQKRLEKEISQITGCPGIATIDMINQLEYLDNVVMETLRLLPINNMRRRKSKGAIFLENTHFPRNAELDINLQKMHHDPKLWRNPETFHPERFHSECQPKQNPYQFLPFGAGTNFCLGMKLSIMIIKVLIVRILSPDDGFSSHRWKTNR